MMSSASVRRRSASAELRKADLVIIDEIGTEMTEYGKYILSLVNEGGNNG